MYDPPCLPEYLDTGHACAYGHLSEFGSPGTFCGYGMRIFEQYFTYTLFFLSVAVAGGLKKLAGDVNKLLHVLTFKIHDLDKHAQAAPSMCVIVWHFTKYTFDVNQV